MEIKREVKRVVDVTVVNTGVHHGSEDLFYLRVTQPADDPEYAGEEAKVTLKVAEARALAEDLIEFLRKADINQASIDMAVKRSRGARKRSSASEHALMVGASNERARRDRLRASGYILDSNGATIGHVTGPVLGASLVSSFGPFVTQAPLGTFRHPMSF